MKFFYNPLSAYSQKALIALYEKQVAFEPQFVNLMTPEGRDAYAKVYPIGKIPLLKPSDEHMVPESTSIIEYLEGQGTGGTRLIPADAEAARQVRFMDRMSDLYLNNPTVTLLFNKLGFRASTPEAVAEAEKHLRLTFEHLDARLANQDWLCGEFSMADCAAIPALFYCQMVAPFSDYPNLVRYYERAKQRPSYAKVMAEFVPIWEGMMAQGAPR
jgi:glutathione S-transferase